MPTSLWLDVLRRDLKFTRRVLTKNLAFTTTAIVTLALGIAASTVIYTVVDAVLLQPLDYNDSGDIYRVYPVDTLGLPRGTTGGPHMHPVAEEGELIQAAIYGYSFEQSVVNDEGTIRGQRIPNLGRVFRCLHRAVAHGPRIRASRGLSEHDLELSNVARRLQ